MKEQSKVWLITGISRGLGKAIAEEVLSRGDIVIGTSRNGKASKITGNQENLHLFALDVSYPDEVKSVVEKAQQLYGRIDVLVNNAGYGLLGAVEETSMAELHQQFDVNFFGTLYMIQACLPIMRKQEHGHILNLSSIAGLAPTAGYGLYAASKFAVEGLSQSLKHELQDLGIRVTVIEPGSFRTDFLDETSLHRTKLNISAYDSSSGALSRFMQKLDGSQPGDPKLGAKAIVDVVYSPEAPLHLVLGSDAYGRTKKMLIDFIEELERGKSISLSTDYKDAVPSIALFQQQSRN